MEVVITLLVVVLHLDSQFLIATDTVGLRCVAYCIPQKQSVADEGSLVVVLETVSNVWWHAGSERLTSDFLVYSSAAAYVVESSASVLLM